MAKPLLIVEDNADLRLMLGVYFRKAGQEVVVAQDGDEALRIFSPGKFELVLADVNLGDGMNGIEVVRKLREQDPEIKVFIMSGEPHHLRTAKESGFESCLPKPLDFARMPQLLGLAA